MIKFHNTKIGLDKIPNKNQLERCTLKELFVIAAHKPIKGHSLKTILIDYIMNFKKLG